MALRDLFRRRRAKEPVGVTGDPVAPEPTAAIAGTPATSAWREVGRLSRTAAHPMTGDWSSFASSLAVRNQPVVLRAPMHDVSASLVGTFSAPTAIRPVGIDAPRQLDLSVRRRAEAQPVRGDDVLSAAGPSFTGDPAGDDGSDASNPAPSAAVAVPSIRRALKVASPLPAIAPITVPPLVTAGLTAVSAVSSTESSAGLTALRRSASSPDRVPVQAGDTNLAVPTNDGSAGDESRPLRPRIVEVTTRTGRASGVSRQPATLSDEPVPGGIEAFGVRMARSTAAADTRMADALTGDAGVEATAVVSTAPTSVAGGLFRSPSDEADGIAGSTDPGTVERAVMPQASAIDHRLELLARRPHRVLAVLPGRIDRSAVGSAPVIGPHIAAAAAADSAPSPGVRAVARSVIPHRPLVSQLEPAARPRPAGVDHGTSLHRFPSIGDLADRTKRLPGSVGSPAVQRPAMPRRVPTVAGFPTAPGGAGLAEVPSWTEGADHLSGAHGFPSLPSPSPLSSAFDAEMGSVLPSLPGSPSFPAIDGRSLATRPPALRAPDGILGAGAGAGAVRAATGSATALAERASQAFGQLPPREGFGSAVDAMQGGALADVSDVAGVAGSLAGTVAGAVPSLPPVPSLPTLPDLQTLTDKVADRVERRLRAELLRERERKGSLSGGGRR